MKKLLPFLLLVFITSCPILDNRYSVARIKERYACNIQIENRSSYNLEYKYAPVPMRMDYNDLSFVKEYNSSINEFLKKANSKSHLKYINIFGTLSKDSTSKNLYTGIDCGVHSVVYIVGYPNVNVDGLPARFVLMIEGDSRAYSLVYNCEKKNETSTVVITDDTIKRLQTFKDDEFKRGYNGRRDYYGKSVAIEDRLYCFERIDIKKNSLNDYSKIPETDFSGILYARVFLTRFFSKKYPELPEADEVLILYNDNEEKFYYVKDDASVNLIV